MATSLLPRGIPSRFGISRAALREIAYLLSVPLLLGLLFGWVRASRTGAWPLPLSISYWIAICMIDWLLCDLGSRLARRVLQPWHPALWLVLLTGALLVQWPILIVNSSIVLAFQSAFIAPDLHTSLPETSWAIVVRSLVPGVALWLGVNLALFRWVGLPRYGFTPPAGVAGLEAPVVAPASTTLHSRPAFMARVPEKLGSKLLAVSAEEHYLRVITELGSALVLYRMSDAVRELEAWPGLGAQVHRSWWVAKSAIEGAERRDGNVHLLLRNGMRVPVSRSFRQRAEERGLLLVN